MISLRYRSLQEAVESFSQGVGEFEKVGYWVTDRRRLTSYSDYELEWGNLILLLAWDGKLALILKRCEEGHETPPEQVVLSRLARLRESWATYAADFQAEVETHLEEQFQRSVLGRMHTVANATAALTILEDLALFLDERDTVEMFFEASERYFAGTPFRQRLDATDRQIRNNILGEVRPALVREYGAESLDDLSTPWLPQAYWWRHLGSSFTARG